MADKTYTVAVNIVGDPSGGTRAARKVADEAETASGRIRKAFGSSLSTIGGALGGALEPVQVAFDNIDQALDQMGEKAKTNAQKIGNVMTGIGAGSVGIGTLLTAAGSKDQQAKNQLIQAISDVGGSYDDYSDRIEATNKRMAKFGYTADESMNAIQQLTQATHDPAKALSLMGEAANLAAARHESLGVATTQLSEIIAGKGTRVLQQLGITHIAVGASAKVLTKATTDQQKAQDELAKAQKHLSDLEDVDHAKKKLTIQDQINLRDAHNQVLAAQQKLAASNTALQKAQAATTSSGQDVQTMLNEVAQVTNGQASAAANTYTGRIRALRAEIENQVATIGQKYGPALTAAGAGMTVLGSIVSGTSGILDRFRQKSQATGSQVKADADKMAAAQSNMGEKAAVAAGEQDALAGAESAAGTEAAVAEGEVGTLGATEVVAGDAAGVAAGEQDALAGAEDTVGASATTAAGEVEALAAAEGASGAGEAGIGLAGGATVLGGGAGIAAVTGYGIYTAATDSVGNPGSNYSSGYGIYSQSTEQQLEQYGNAHGAGSAQQVSPYGPTGSLVTTNFGNLGANAAILAGHRAGGGPVTAGQVYWVGENGPEPFVPGASGYVYPNGGGARSGGSAAGGGDLHLTMVLNGREVARAILPDIRTVAGQTVGRNAVRIGLG